MVDRQKWLRITLIIMAIDYLFVGIYTIVLPDLFSTAGTLTINTSQVLITIGLFALLISRNTIKYKDFIWILVVQQIGNILVHIYQILNEISDFYMNLIIIAINFIYLVGLLVFREQESGIG
ncbi:MAG: hypothetical protein ACW97W_14325 [Candidatus Hodarchaeales archaeon]|jgi:hypothetical protein